MLSGKRKKGWKMEAKYTEKIATEQINAEKMTWPQIIKIFKILDDERNVLPNTKIITPLITKTKKIKKKLIYWQTKTDWKWTLERRVTEIWRESYKRQNERKKSGMRQELSAATIQKYGFMKKGNDRLKNVKWRRCRKKK